MAKNPKWSRQGTPSFFGKARVSLAERRRLRWLVQGRFERVLHHHYAQAAKRLAQAIDDELYERYRNGEFND